MTPTADPGVRHCGACQRNVYFCLTDAETISHAKAGDCVARDRPARDQLGPMIIGRPQVRPTPTPAQLEARRLVARERAIDDILAWDFDAYNRVCTGCGYPIPTFRLSCKVCGNHVGRSV